MNKFAFFFPAKIIFAERNIELQKFVFTKDGKYLTFYLGPIGKNIYFSSDKGRIVVENSSDDMRQILIKTGDCYSIMQNILIANIEDFLNRQFEFIESSLPKWQSRINNPELYEQEAAERREKIKAERAIADKEYEERQKQRAAAAEKDYRDAIMAFLNGEQISWGYIERACKENGIIIPIQTLGFGRKHVTRIGQNSMTTTGKYNSPKVWVAVKALHDKLNVINSINNE